MQTFFMECNDWIGKSQGGGGSTTRALKPSKNDPRRLKTNYHVVVYTSDVKGAGTDANVFLEIHGETGSSERHKLEAKGTKDFERGSNDCFEITERNLGQIKMIKIGHDNQVIK